MARSWTANRHVIVLLIAMAMGAYQMLKLEQRRADRDVDVDVEFDRAVALLRAHFTHQQTAGDYQVLLTHRHGASSSPTEVALAMSRTALVVNRSPPIPRIEAELVVDATIRSKASTHSRVPSSARARMPKPTTQPTKPKVPLLKFLVYDSEAMRAAATQLEQRELAYIVRHGPPIES